MWHDHKKLDKKARKCMMHFKLKCGIIALVIGGLWAAELMNYFDFDLLMPTIVILIGLLCLLKAAMLGSKLC